MTVKEFLETVRKGLEADNIQDADKVVRVVAGALKAGMPQEAQTALEEAANPPRPKNVSAATSARKLRT